MKVNKVIQKISSSMNRIYKIIMKNKKINNLKNDYDIYTIFRNYNFFSFKVGR